MYEVRGLLEFQEQDWHLLAEKMPEWQKTYEVKQAELLVKAYQNVLDADITELDKFCRMKALLERSKNVVGMKPLSQVSMGEVQRALRDYVKTGAIGEQDLQKFSNPVRKALKAR